MEQSLPVSHVVGIGKTKAALLADAGIRTVEDLLHYFPLRYEDKSVKPFEAFVHGSQVTARAVVDGAAKIRWTGKRSIVSAAIRVDGRVRLTAMWFNQPYLRQKLVDGQTLVVSGRYDAERRVIVVSQTDFSLSPAHLGGALTPVYRSVGGMSSSQLQSVIERALTQFGDRLPDVLPAQYREKYRLISHPQAVFAMHRPRSSEDLHQAHRRLAFEEFFLFQLQLQWYRAQETGVQEGTAHNVPADVMDQFAAILPYPLTEAQREACSQIVADMRTSRAMARLLQGDVGSGKTWVAFYAIFAAARSGAQSALMAPTELLAEQHFRNAEPILGPLGVRMRLLTGSTTESARQEILRALADGQIDLLIGTHALLTDRVQFHDLGLVVTDEQHRFGVAQRSVLRDKGRVPDVLMLTATPIPRTLALAVYGDLDVSVLRERPAGRQPISTVWLPFAREANAIRLARRHLARAEQVYVVAPLVESSEALTDVRSATELVAHLQDEFAGYKTDLLHGRMSTADKDAVMRRFLAGEVQVLVSTTVIEVGIDVPSATVMLIYHAERFGLAQLHQLRGRVGRGERESECVLLSDAGNDMARARLQTMVDTTDGFVIAERDLELRGPGEFLGVRQSGLPEFSVGDLTRDLKVMEVARDEASQLLSKPDFWLLPRYGKLREWMEQVPQAGWYRA